MCFNLYTLSVINGIYYLHSRNQSADSLKICSKCWKLFDMFPWKKKRNITIKTSWNKDDQKLNNLLETECDCYFLHKLIASTQEQTSVNINLKFYWKCFGFGWPTAFIPTNVIFYIRSFSYRVWCISWKREIT